MAKPTITEQFARAAKYGIKYEYRQEQVKEGQFVVIDTVSGKEWSRGTGEGILRLMAELVRRKKLGKPILKDQV